MSNGTPLPIAASEVNRFCYCRWQWYYTRVYGAAQINQWRRERNEARGIPASEAETAFDRGRDFHARYTGRYAARLWLRRLGVAALLAALIFLFITGRAQAFASGADAAPSNPVSPWGWLREIAGLDPRLLAVPVGLAVILLAQAALSLWPRGIRKRRPALPGYGWRLVYTDNAPKTEKRASGVTYGKRLADPRHGLQGKPDMVYASGNQVMPVELKSGRIGDSPRPHTGDLMQLVVYFLLAESEYGVRPREGRLIYRDGMFVAANTRKLRAELLRTVQAMRDMLDDPPAAPGPEEGGFTRCRHCGCRGTVCAISGKEDGLD